jgi:catechol 2,3-dioxygenase-like lactoylglutathione lyase family enzyme
MSPPRVELSGITLSTPDTQALALFYQRLLGWELGKDEPGWAKLYPPGGGPGLSFHIDEDYIRPTWPSTPGEQQMMVHLDIQVDNLETAGIHATEAGSKLAEYQPQEGVRVYLDPDGHPFCLFLA